jgi:hypothetical protein
MMKKKLFLLSLITLPLFVSCNFSETITPTHEYPGDPFAGGGSEQGGEQGGGGADEEVNMTVNFYLNNSNSDTPLYSMRWYMLKPLGSLPEQAKITDAMAPDPLYPHFIGYSEYPSSLDESHIWNFETDYKQGNVLSLYGIWVSA